MTEFRFVRAWKLNDPKMEQDAIAVWRQHNILPLDATPEARAFAWGPHGVKCVIIAISTK